MATKPIQHQPELKPYLMMNDTESNDCVNGRLVLVLTNFYSSRYYRLENQ